MAYSRFKYDRLGRLREEVVLVNETLVKPGKVIFMPKRKHGRRVRRGQPGRVLAFRRAASLMSLFQ